MNSQDYNNNFHKWEVPSIDNLFASDPKLKQFEMDIRKRYAIYEKNKMAIEQSEGFDRFTQGFKEFGVFVTPEGGVMCKEWIPNARAVYLSGDFNNWEKWSYECKDHGKWEMYIRPHSDGPCPIRHLSKLKLFIETHDHQRLERISPWAKYVTRQGNGNDFQWLFWNPPKNQMCMSQSRRPLKPLGLKIYEAHIGVSSNRCEIASYRQFTSNVLPRIKDLGYNCVLLMAIKEHPFYPSLGYQVSNFFAASSRFGTPEDLKELVNVAHGMGITVIMDVVHHQASSNVNDGLNMFDGTRGCYFKDDESGYRNSDGSRIFDLTKWEVLRFLLSNLRYYMDEFNMDGFRFNGIHTMLYHDQGRDRWHSNDYRQYFGMQMNLESMAYLALANDLLHSRYPNVITIAEDHSNMPGMSRPVREGGIGFDYTISTSIPQKWMQLLNQERDEDWSMEFIFNAMTQRRAGEKVLALNEGHDQSLIGNCTIITKLMGEEICRNMSDMIPMTSRVDRGISLHKVFRLMTHSLIGDGYLNFMGNEFGHPDFLELPSPSNNDSYHYARRRFELCDDEQLRFKYLKRFDQALNRAEEKYGWLSSPPAFVSRKHEQDKVFVYERGDLLFLFNFHPTRSYPDYKVGVDKAGTYKIILDTDEKYFGGHGRNQSSVEFHTRQGMFDGRRNSLLVYVPSRSALVLSSRTYHNVPLHQQIDGGFSTDRTTYTPHAAIYC
ncbi:1,4-alpha-glucan-branching enzyme-like [Clavelina lepadiformis]|uniref:1,4-alpha-glucan-branching enzyme-like n=1 Tax=Clavelina lepadiformis TaxID=159417 RepID=UPI00404210F5